MEYMDNRRKISNVTVLKNLISCELDNWDVSQYTISHDALAEEMSQNLRQYVGRNWDDISSEELMLSAKEFETEE